MNIRKPPDFKPLAKKRTFTEIVEQIKSAVYSGHYKPNDRLPSERELAEQFNSGRMAVREALRVLEEAGFVSIKQGSQGGAFIEPIGTKVVKRSLKDYIMLGDVSVRELADARLCIELAVAKLSIKHITKEELGLLDGNIRETIKLSQENKDTTANVVKFHLILARAAKNQILETILEGILNIYVSGKWSVKEEYKIQHHIDEHKKIYEALKKKNLPQFKQAIIDHVNSVSKRFQKSLTNEPEQ